MNAGLTTGCAPPTHKKGIIVLIPKPGETSTDAADMRPITLLPELGKLLNRIIAARFTAIVHESPSLLAEAQRAYLHDGNSRQSIHSVFDVCEDFAERQARDPEADLIQLFITNRTPLFSGQNSTIFDIFMKIFEKAIFFHSPSSESDKSKI